MPDSNKDVIVIGAGIAGMTAAKQLAKQGFSVLNIEAVLFGGLVININELDGELQGSGAELASNLMMEIGELGVESVDGSVSAIAREGSLLKVTTDSATYLSRAVIVASGAGLKRLGIPGEASLDGKGVAQCADCDGPMYMEQTVAVVGGGDSALQEALVLAGYAGKVQLIHRGSKFSARQHLIDAVAARGNIVTVWNTVVDEICGQDAVSELRVRNVVDGKTSTIACTGIFAYVGLEPNSGFLPAEVKRAANGLVETDAKMQTGMPGVFAAGAVRSGYGGMLNHAISEAQAAAASAVKMLEG